MASRCRRGTPEHHRLSQHSTQPRVTTKPSEAEIRCVYCALGDLRRKGRKSRAKCVLKGRMIKLRLS
ncbi:hypothetical protein E2C01_079080 [Portunus trituberculatus]|uniref:Uncharacterized protein n=1 Tax=Portunus trituberculatus TaxID=210409 RepID=A0A5B7IPN8_PORTR|nr:hypothetical protein [Portunus trituberculatus]